MGIIDKFTTPKNIKGQRNMLSIIKAPASDLNSFNKELYRMQLINMKTHELEILVDIYVHITPNEFKEQVELIKAELEFRETPLGKELY